MSLERASSVGIGAPLSAQDVFTDRSAETESFLEAARAVSRFHGRPDLTQDVAWGRRNVLVFHGMGGMGKTTLSHELEHRFLAGETQTAKRYLSARFDFDSKLPGSSALLDLETLMLRLRAALGAQHAGWAAFDLALAAYWDKKNPGQTLREFLDKRGGLPALVNTDELQEQIDQAVEGLLDSLGAVRAARRIGGLLGRRILTARRKKRILGECAWFELILEEPDPDIMLIHLPLLLSYDLAKAQETLEIAAAVFIDTLEEVQHHREDHGGLEDAIARLAYQMPNVLFMVTGRNRLTWGDENTGSRYKYSGPERWPQLAAQELSKEPRQHLLGALSREDCDLYLKNRLLKNGQAAIPASIRRRIVAGSAGLPYYLDLSADYFDKLIADGRDARVDHFGGPFTKLVVRLLRDLGPQERDLLRMAALVGSFSEALLIAVSSSRHAHIRQFIHRQFVQGPSDGWLPYRLHECLRQSVLECEAALSDAWSTQEWEETTVRAIKFYERTYKQLQLESSVRASESGQNGPVGLELTEIFSQTLQLSRSRGLAPKSLIAMARSLRQLGFWGFLGSVPDADPQENPNLHALVRVCRAVAARNSRNTAEALTTLQGLAEQPLDDDYRQHVLHEMALTAMVAGELDAADWAFGHLEAAGAVAPDIRLGRAGSALRRGRLREALKEADVRVTGTYEEASKIDLQGHVLLQSARFEDAEARFQSVAEIAQSGESPLWRARAARHMALSVAWTRAEDGVALAAAAKEANEDLGDGIGLAQTHIAMAIALARKQQHDRSRENLNEGRRLLEDLGAKDDLALLEVAQVFLHMCLEEFHDARAARARLTAGLRRAAASPVWGLVTGLWLEDVTNEELESVQWSADLDRVREGWRSVLPTTS